MSCFYLSIMLNHLLKSKRLELELSLRTLASTLSIDTSLLSRIEKGERIPTEKQLVLFANALTLDYDILVEKWLEEKVYKLLQGYPESANQVMLAMESRIEYLTSTNAYIVPNIPESLQDKIAKIDKLKEKWNKLKPNNGLQLDKIDNHFSLEYTYQSNRIEGNTLTLQETFLVIEQGLTIAGKPINEHLEAINHDDAIEFVNDIVVNDLVITEYRLKQMHNLVLKGIDRKNAGVYRTVPVRIGGSAHIPPQPYLLQKLMEDYFIHYTKQKNKMHPVLLAADMHERLVSIHPFIDGNGRTSRLIMNMILLKYGYTVAILKGNDKNRLQYYKALETVQVDNNPLLFYELIIDTVQESLEEHLSLI